ncbi:dynactin subunit 1 isoform X2 [Bacillus rossius redtenbacheri]|uniref:dynactin subunit 1 isoform X2 n=1 Tax=Bacillus rossius redtenbacheri TaxID=93214 RepID=UPI002FDCB2A9
MADGRAPGLRVNQRVEVTGKDVQGVVAYVGTTLFSSGKWIGVILDEPKGKNNGTVKGKTYFQCKDNHGMFVRQAQLTLLDEGGDATTPSSGATSPDDAKISRSKLSSSRLSLASSRSQGDSTSSRDDSLAGTPMRESASPQQAPDTPAKRASFVERSSPATSKELSKRPQSLVDANLAQDQTGFLETLNPQFTPGQAMVSPGAGPVEERLTLLQCRQESDNLRAEVADLKEKLDTLRLKRLQDGEKLREYEKTRLQLDQLLEFKARIMESQASLQRELQRARQEAKDAVEARNAHAEEMADLSETVEMATLDKEMAEEKSEMLQAELSETRDRLEEMTLDLELLKAELQERGSDNTGAPTSYEMKQLHIQNARLKDTIVRMRDLTAHEKHESQKLQKDLDQKRSEVQELTRTKEKLSARVDELERMVADLQEQVDACLGAEEMVQQLGDAKLTLEDRVKELEESVADLEALHDMDESLLEGCRDLELELREELDMADAQARQAMREKEAALETLADREQTILKFRELVQRLQEALQELRQQQESAQPASALPDMLDFKKMFEESKAHTRAIDLELRRIDVQQSNQHVQYLTAYMPDSFMSRGGDHDAVLALLLVPRMLWKVELLLAQLRDKFPEVNRVDRAAVVGGHAVQQSAFKSRLSYLLLSLQTVLHQLVAGMNTCAPATLLKVGGSYPDMAVQEKVLDSLLELHRRDQLDETVELQQLERSLHYFCSVLPALLGPEARADQACLVADCCLALAAACDNVRVQALGLRALMQAGQEGGDMGLLMQHLVTAAETVAQQLKVIRRGLPHDRSISQLGLPASLPDRLQQCSQHAARVMRSLLDTVRASLHHVATSGEADIGISHDKLKELGQAAIDQVYEQDDRSPIECVKNSISYILGEVATLMQTMQEAEFDIVNLKAEEKPTPPIVVRALTVKKELEETKNLKHKLEMKESDIKELKLSLKQKQEELSEMTIRKELAEKKLGSLNKDNELTIEKLQRKLDDAQQLLRRKEKEFEETMDHLQADIDSLESERGELKEKLKGYSKKALDGGGGKAPALAGPAPGNYVGGVRDSSQLGREVHALRLALQTQRREKSQLQVQLMKQQLSSLPPLQVPKKTSVGSGPSVDHDAALTEVLKKASALQKEVYDALARPALLDISNRVPGSPAWADQGAPTRFLAYKQERQLDLQRRVQALQDEVLHEVVKRKAGGKVEADFADFPTRELAKALAETEPRLIGQLSVPAALERRDAPAVVPLHLDTDGVQRLHQALCY